MSTALGGALHNVFLMGAVFAALALASGFWLPAGSLKPATEEKESVAQSPAECERLLMAEMTQIDPENEPAAVEEK
jgi:hypothetical protein